MPLLPFADCGLPADGAGCDALYRTASAILQAAYGGLEPWVPDPEICDGISSYVSLDEAPADCCDLLAVWLTRYGPSGKAGALEERTAGGGGLWPMMRASYSVALWESCYPTIQGGGDEPPRFPNPDVVDEHNEHLYSHGLAMYEAVIRGYLGGTLFSPATACPKLSFGDLVPLGPNGGCAGFGFQVLGELSA